MKTHFYIYDFAEYVFDYAGKIFGATAAEKVKHTTITTKVVVINGTGQIVAYATINYDTNKIETVIGGFTKTRDFAEGTTFHSLAYDMAVEFVNSEA